MPPLPEYEDGGKAIPKANPWPLPANKEIPLDESDAEAAASSSEGTEDDQTLAQRAEVKSRLRSGASSSAVKRPAPALDTTLEPPPKQRRTVCKRVARKVLKPPMTDVKVCRVALILLE